MYPYYITELLNVKETAVLRRAGQARAAGKAGRKNQFLALRRPGGTASCGRAPEKNLEKF